jgi:hypothetical protein
MGDQHAHDLDQDQDDPAERVEVIQRVAQALEGKETGEPATITLDPEAGDSAPLLPRRGA